MTLEGIILVLLSAILHASWNFLSKCTEADPVSFMTEALIYSAICYLPLFIVLQFFMKYDMVYVICVVSSGICCGFYFYALGKAYLHGHVSVAYPVARSFPLLVLVWSGLFLGEVPSMTGGIGVFCVIAGCFILPLKKFCLGEEGFVLKHYLNRSCFWALLSAVFTSIYSMIDKYSTVRPADGGLVVSIIQKVNYVYIQNTISLIVLLAIFAFTGFKIVQVRRKRVLWSGLVFLVSYALIMMAFVGNQTSYVVSLRQFSIVITAVLSMWFIEKDFSVPRLVGVVIIFGGVILIGIS